jgi:lipopolysaccharide export LptBFGC system permease protein LptF
MCRPAHVAKEDVVQPERGLWRAVRWPLLVLVVAVLGIAVAAVLDRTASREWALTIGAPALTVLLPVGLVWLVVAVVVDAMRRRG